MVVYRVRQTWPQKITEYCKISIATDEIQTTPIREENPTYSLSHLPLLVAPE